MAVSPLEAIAELYRQVQHVRTPTLEREFAAMSAALRGELGRTTTTQDEDALSPMARKILDVLGHQAIHRTGWARQAGSCVSADSGTFKAAVKELVDAGLVVRTKRGNYRKRTDQTGPKDVVPISSSSQAAS